uniref:Uncharacterized protein n=1 Tax=Anguilla anguilla TaxID=7936 RepID=A0A0E9QJU1_ANGAN
MLLALVAFLGSLSVIVDCVPLIGLFVSSLSSAFIQLASYQKTKPSVLWKVAVPLISVR